MKARPRGALVVRAPSSALVSIDGGELKPPPVEHRDVVFGEHFVRVEDPGRHAWAHVVPLAQSILEIDVTAQPSLALDDAEAVMRARRMDAAFALVAELKPGTPQHIELRLIDAATGRRRDSTSVPFPGETGALDAAVMRLDEGARQAAMASGGGATTFGTSTQILIEPAPPKAFAPASDPATNPAAWARARWPLVAAIGVSLATAVALGFVVAGDRDR